MIVTPAKVTGALYLLPVLAVIPFWYILLFVGNLPNPDYAEMLRFWFFEKPHRLLFWYYAALPVVCGVFAAVYLAGFMSDASRAGLAFLLGVVLAVSAWLFTFTGIAVFVSLPLLYGGKTAWSLIASRRTRDAV